MPILRSFVLLLLFSQVLFHPAESGGVQEPKTNPDYRALSEEIEWSWPPPESCSVYLSLKKALRKLGYSCDIDVYDLEVTIAASKETVYTFTRVPSATFLLTDTNLLYIASPGRGILVAADPAFPCNLTLTAVDLEKGKELWTTEFMDRKRRMFISGPVSWWDDAYMYLRDGVLVLIGKNMGEGEYIELVDPDTGASLARRMIQMSPRLHDGYD